MDIQEIIERDENLKCLMAISKANELVTEMKLSQKIKYIKRHRANKRFAKYVDDIHFAAAECFLTGNENIFIVSPRLYNVMNCRKGYVPKNIKSSALNCDDNQIITVPRDITEFWNDNQLKYLKEYCGLLHKESDEETVNQLSNIPLGQFVSPELYMGIDLAKSKDISAGIREM